MDDTNTKRILQWLFLSISALIAVNAFIAPGAASMTLSPDTSTDIVADAAPLLAATSGQAKNVILLIGDGMGSNQIEAARWEKAGHDPAAYRTTRLALDGLSYRGNLTTASANNAVTDSAAAATALMTGVKTNNGYIGVNPSGFRLTTIAELADAGGRATGVITTTRTTDATPAGAYAHVTNRNNEALIASQFLDSDLEVALGGGYSYFISTGTSDPWGTAGLRTDGRNLVTEAKGQGYNFATTASSLSAAPATSTTKVLGLFASANMAYEAARASTQEPTLAAMTGKALSVLSTDPDGFFLMVEGGKIDTAASAGNYALTTEQVLIFDDAVATALSFAAQHPDTLVVVTADHETGGLTARTNADGTLSFSFTTVGYHTAANVPIRASGPCAERFSAVTVPNTQVFTVMRDAMSSITPTPTPTPTTTTAPAQSPYNGPHTVPCQVQAEDFDSGGQNVSYYDTTAGNQGGAGRLSEAVDVRTINGITDIAYIGAGEWTEYTVSVPSGGSYTANFRVGTNRDGGQIAATTDGAPGCTITVPNTGSYTAYQTVAAPLSLTQGTHVIRLTYVTGYASIDWFEVASAAASTPTITSISPNVQNRGTTIAATITGTNFAPGAQVAVSNGAVQYTAQNEKTLSSTQISCTLTLSSTAPLGAYSVKVQNPGQAWVSRASAFTVAGPLTVTGISPTSAKRGTTITAYVAGTNFAPDAQVKFTGGGTTLSATGETTTSANQIRCTVTIPSTAYLGYFTVSVQNKGMSTWASKASAFRTV